MQKKIDTKKVAEAVKSLAMDGSTLKQLKGVTNDELEAVYSLAFGYYRTGKFDEALKLFQFLVLFDHLNAKFWFGLGAVQQATKNYQDAVASYGYCSFLNLENPKPQLHAAECFLALGDKLAFIFLEEVFGGFEHTHRGVLSVKREVGVKIAKVSVYYLHQKQELVFLNPGEGDCVVIHKAVRSSCASEFVGISELGEFAENVEIDAEGDLLFALRVRVVKHARAPVVCEFKAELRDAHRIFVADVFFAGNLGAHWGIFRSGC